MPLNTSIVKALIVKECKNIKRDPSNWVVAFVFPLLLLVIFGYGISFNIENIRVHVVLEDCGKYGHDLASAYMNSKYFNATVVRSEAEACGHMESGKTQGIITIPKSFSKKILTGRQPAINVTSDGADPNTASYVEAYTAGVFNNWLHKKGKISITDRLWFNSSTETINFVMSGVLTMILSIVGTFLTSMVVAREWEKGTMEFLMSTQVSAYEIIIAKIVPYFCLCILSFVFALLYGIYIFNVPFEGSILAMSLITAVFITVSLLIGLIISTVSKNLFVASMATVLVTFLPAIMLSGFVFEIKSMPYWLQALTYLFPAKYYVTSIRTILLVGDVWDIIIRDVCVLSTIASLLFWRLKNVFIKNVE